MALIYGPPTRRWSCRYKSQEEIMFKI